jgi:hypothetical protein
MALVLVGPCAGLRDHNAVALPRVAVLHLVLVDGVVLCFRPATKLSLLVGVCPAACYPSCLKRTSEQCVSGAESKVEWLKTRRTSETCLDLCGRRLNKQCMCNGHSGTGTSG